jgi:Ca2+-binding RTX toxin-like protein
MTRPEVDPNGGLTGSIGDGAGRRVDYSGIETLRITTGFGDDVVWGGALSGAGGFGHNIFRLGEGDDLFHDRGGSDSVDAGAGVDGFSGDFGHVDSEIYWSLLPTFLSGFQDVYANFDYFVSITTGSGQDHIITSQVDRNDTIILGGNSDIATVYNGHDFVNGGAAGAGGIDSGSDLLVVNYLLATAGVHNLGVLTSNGAGYSGQIGDGSTRRVTFEAIDRFVILTGSGADNITTGDGDDQVRTGGGNDIIATGGGDDLLDGGDGDDVMTGGSGDDFYWVSSHGDVVNENEGEGTDEVHTALAVYSLVGLPNVEKLSASTNLLLGRDFRGNSANNVIKGSDAADILRLHDGGDDIVLAGAGNDILFFIGSLTGADVIDGGAGTDTLVLQGAYGSLTLTSNITLIENISILAGSNTAFGEPGTNRYDYVLTTHDSNFAAGVQARINAAALLEGEDFTFDGSAETNASFVVYGGRGRDALVGGLGNDIFFFAEERFASGDTVNGGAGYNGMFLRGNYTIDFNAPGYTGLFTNIHNLTLTSATDERYARGGGTEFDYNITLSNLIVGAGQTLTVSGTLLLATESMILDGSQETDGFLRLFGGKSNDVLKGGGQNDLIHGNLGADILAGNGGADSFRYQDTAESNSGSMDHILDFTPGTDRIELDRIDADTLTAGNQAFSWIGSGAFTGTAGQLRAYEQSGTWFVEGDTNGDGIADLVIALTLQGATPLGAGDFLL